MSAGWPLEPILSEWLKNLAGALCPNQQPVPLARIEPQAKKGVDLLMLLLVLQPPLKRVSFSITNYYSWPEYAGISITINHAPDLHIELSLMQSYWGWHIVLLNPDMSWLILWWGVKKVSFSGLPRRVIARSFSDQRGQHQNYKAVRKWLPGNVLSESWCTGGAGRRDLENVMMSFTDLDVSRLQSGRRGGFDKRPSWAVLSWCGHRKPSLFFERLTALWLKSKGES